MSRAVPRINTQRLTLRGMITEDFKWFSTMWAIPELSQDLPFRSGGRGEAWSAFLRNAGQWQTVGYGQWAVVDRSSRALVGHVGFLSQSEGENGGERRVEACWIVEPRVRGSGLGQEAAEAAHDWFDRVVRVPTRVLIADGNTFGAQSAQRMGYRPAGGAASDGEASLLVRRARI